MMAAAPPAAGATPGTPHTTTTTMAAHSITTYAEHYAALPDDLQGCYDLLLAPYDPASGRSHQQLLHRLLSMSETSPKVTEFRQPLQVQSHLEMPGILVQLGHIQRI